MKLSLSCLALLAVLVIHTTAAAPMSQPEVAAVEGAMGLQSTDPVKQVHIIYLTPSDRDYKPEYESALVAAAQRLNDWFDVQLGGYRFVTPADSVQWYRMNHPAAWYQTNPSSSRADLRFWHSVTGEAFTKTGGGFYQPNDRWLIYIDADPLPGQSTGGTSGVALFPANDLRGLNGESLWPVNPGDSTHNPGFDRWVGGMGHELGHAMGLPHPPGSPGGPFDDSLMYLGYLDFPDTYLRAEEKVVLRESGFFIPEPNTLALCVFAGAFLLTRAGTRRRACTK